MNTKTKIEPEKIGGGGSRRYRILKRVFDLSAALLGGVILLPLMLVIGALIRLDSPGPALFRQERLGREGAPFILYKFRSMTMDAERDGPCWAQPNDRRCTRLGLFLRRTHLDELPQLWNILRGDMSFVGPRPERACFYARLEKELPYFRLRLQVTPGLTGLAQISGDYSRDPEGKLEWDLRYIAGCSLRLDLRCIFRTLVLGSRARLGKEGNVCRPIPF